MMAQTTGYTRAHGHESCGAGPNMRQVRSMLKHKAAVRALLASLEERPRRRILVPAE